MKNTIPIALLLLFLAGCKSEKDQLAELCLKTPNAQKEGANAEYICRCAASRTVNEFPDFSIRNRDWVESFGKHVENCILGR